MYLSQVSGTCRRFLLLLLGVEWMSKAKNVSAFLSASPLNAVPSLLRASHLRRNSGGGHHRGKVGMTAGGSSARVSALASSGSRKGLRISAETLRPPEKWREQLERVRHMRRLRDAAVDTAGADALKDPAAGNPIEVRFQVLMSAMLSSQTKDPVTAAALGRMREACAPAALGAASLASALDEDALAALLHPVSFAKTKAKHIKLVCERLSGEGESRVAGDIPSTVEGLLDLPGVGPKMTYLVMDIAWGRNEGICVDTHVHRISNRLGWVDTWNRKKNGAQNPEKTRKHLQAWLPREHWSEINELLVGFGQQVCKAIGPSCSTCDISSMCPSFATKGNLSWRDMSPADNDAHL